MARKQTSRVWESVSKSPRSFRREEKIILQFVHVNSSSLMMVGQLYHPLACNKAQLQNCLDILKPKGHCTSVVSVVLLVIGFEKKMCPYAIYNQPGFKPIFIAETIMLII